MLLLEVRGQDYTVLDAPVDRMTLQGRCRLHYRVHLTRRLNKNHTLSVDIRLLTVTHTHHSRRRLYVYVYSLPTSYYFENCFFS